MQLRFYQGIRGFYYEGTSFRNLPTSRKILLKSKVMILKLLDSKKILKYRLGIERRTIDAKNQIFLTIPALKLPYFLEFYLIVLKNELSNHIFAATSGFSSHLQENYGLKQQVRFDLIWTLIQRQKYLLLKYYVQLFVLVVIKINLNIQNVI